DVKEGNVVLKKSDGTTVTVPLDRLSLADVRYVEKYLKEATAAVGKRVDDKTSGKSAPTEKSSAKSSSSGGDREPPLARPNASKWQVHPDPGGDVQIRDVAISLPTGFGSGDLLMPATASRFVGHMQSGL